MGMSNIKKNFAITEDGTIMRFSDELDIALLNIIRVNANKDDILAAYKAREKCYKLCKESLNRKDYKEYVETLQLDNFPNELKKAEYGKRYVSLLKWLVLCIIIGISCLGFGLIILYDAFYYSIRFDEILIGLTLVASAVGLYFGVKFLLKQLSAISKSIKDIKC